MSEQETKEEFKKKELSEMSLEELNSYMNSLVESAKDPDITTETQNFIMEEVMAVENELEQRI